MEKEACVLTPLATYIKPRRNRRESVKRKKNKAARVAVESGVTSTAPLHISGHIGINTIVLYFLK